MSLLDSSDGGLLYRCERQDSIIEVRQRDRLRWLHFGDAAVQAAMNLDAPHELVLPYTRSMLAALLVMPVPRRLLNLGFGGGMLVRFFASFMSALEVESVECDERVIALAKQYFPVADTHPVHHTTAEQFVLSGGGLFDLIFCDLFNQNDAPGCLFDETFYRDCRESLSPGGVMAVNLLVTDQERMLELLRGIRKSFPHIALLAVPDHKNTIVLASRQPFPDKAALSPVAAETGRRLGMDMMDLVEELVLPG